MIDFRYHLVSIVAVFLALAIGIIVGATALKPTTENVLHALLQQERKINAALGAQNTSLSRQVAGTDALARAVEPLVLSRLLARQQVVLVTAPGADGQATDGITKAVTLAGGKVTGRVIMQNAFFDASPEDQAKLSTLAATLGTPAGISLAAGSGPQLTGQQAAAKVLTAAIVAKDGAAALTTGQRQQILAGFAGYLQVSGQGGGTSLPAATLAVVVTPARPPANDSDPQNTGLIDIVQGLQVLGMPVVLAGIIAGSGAGSAIDDVTSHAAGISVSTVDNTDTVTGQIMAVQALALLLQPGAKPASYGVGPAAAPSPAPSIGSAPPPVSSSPTATPSNRKSGK